MKICFDGLLPREPRVAVSIENIEGGRRVLLNGKVLPNVMSANLVIGASFPYVELRIAVHEYSDDHVKRRAE